MNLEKYQSNEEQRKNDEALKLGDDVIRKGLEQEGREMAKEVSVVMQNTIEEILINFPEEKVFQIDEAYTNNTSLDQFNAFKDELASLMGPKFKVTDNRTPNGFWPIGGARIVISLEQ